MATERGLGFGLSEAETAEVQRRVRGGETHVAAAAAICRTPRHRWRSWAHEFPIRQWLELLGLPQYSDRFDANDIDLDVVPSLSEQNIEKLGVSRGYRKKLLKAIAHRHPRHCHGERDILDLPPMTTGAFDWVRRMGVHEAYHLDRTNRLIHWVCIPIELAAVLKLLGLVPAGPVDLALLAIGLVGIVYLAANLVVGAVMGLLLLALRDLVLPLTSGSLPIDVAIATVTFVAAFVFQTRVGHGIFEQGIDDTEMNVAELARTKNPIPILLVFAYHALELLFALGYRPALQRAMERHRADELARIPDDPRRR